MKTTLLCALGALLAIGSSSVFAAVGDKATLPSFSKSPLCGPSVTTDSLRGKVILFEYWGIHCGPCRVSMPHLQKLYEKYGNKGFTVIGSHCQNESPAVVTYLKEAGITFPVYQNISIPEARCPGGIPYAVLIGADGRVSAMGHPSSLYAKVETEMAKYVGGYPIIGGLELKKYKSLAKTLVSNGRNIEAKILPVRQEAEEGNEEAALVCKTYDAWLAEEKEHVRTLCSRNPLRAIEAIAQLKAAVPSTTEFDATLEEYRTNPDIQKLLEIQKKVQNLQRNSDKGRRISSSSIKSLNQALDQIHRGKSGGISIACVELKTILSSLAPESKENRSMR